MQRATPQVVQVRDKVQHGAARWEQVQPGGNEAAQRQACFLNSLRGYTVRKGFTRTQAAQMPAGFSERAEAMRSVPRRQPSRGYQ